MLGTIQPPGSCLRAGFLHEPRVDEARWGGKAMALGLEEDSPCLPIFPMTQLSSILLWLPLGEFDL